MFGNCCKTLADAMSSDGRTPLFRVETNGVLYLSVAYAEMENQVGWFDAAVMYCPFCGTKLQDKDEIVRQSKGASVQ